MDAGLCCVNKFKVEREKGREEGGRGPGGGGGRPRPREVLFLKVSCDIGWSR